MIHEQGREQIYHHSEMHDELEQVYYALQDDDDGTGTVYGDTGWYLVVDTGSVYKLIVLRIW